MSDASQPTTKRASTRRARAGAGDEVAPDKPVGTESSAPTAEATQPAPPISNAGDGPAAAPGPEATLPGEQQPLTQPDTESGLIAPQAEVTPPGDANQPSDDTASQAPLPPPAEGGGAGEGAELPPARLPDAEIVAEAATYQTAPAESGDAVATGYFTPPPPDVRGKPRRK